MQSTSEIYRELFNSSYHEKEVRVFVAGVEYKEDKIVSVKTFADLYADGIPSVGGATSREIDLILRQPDDVPRMAKIRLEVRLVLRDWTTGELLQTSEWIPQGIFYTDTRSEDHGDLTLHGYDAMLKLESLYIPASADLTAIPVTMDAMAADIAAKIGITIDTRTQLKAYTVYPPVGYTMREVMSFIAAAHAGNWTMTGIGELQLVPLAGIPAETGYLATEDGDTILFGDVRLIVSDSDTAGKGGDETFVGRNAAALTRGKPLEPCTGVILWWDDENAFRAGDDSGRVLEADCIWATQAMANDVLAAVSDFAYKPYTATGADLDPAAELGDGITVGGLYSVLASVDTTYDARTVSDVAAPGEDEVDREYPYLPPEKRELQRKLTLGKSYCGIRITRQSGLEVVRTMADGTEGAFVRLNSEELAFYDAYGQEALYFDATAGKYRFRGDVEIIGGTMNVNNNFIVKENGDVELNGNIKLSDGTITWGGNAPVKSQFSPDGDADWSDTQRDTDQYRRDWNYVTDDWGAVYKFVGSDGNPKTYLESIGITEIDSEGVKSPRIEGAEIYGGVFSDLAAENYLKVWTTDVTEGDIPYTSHIMAHYVGDSNDSGLPLTAMGYVRANGESAWVLQVLGQTILERKGSTTYARGKWDFSKATVTGV